MSQPVTTQTPGAPVPSITPEKVSGPIILKYFNVTGKPTHISTYIPCKLAYLGGKPRIPIAQKETQEFQTHQSQQTDKAENYTKIEDS